MDTPCPLLPSLEPLWLVHTLLFSQAELRVSTLSTSLPFEHEWGAGLLWPGDGVQVPHGLPCSPVGVCCGGTLE